MKRLKSLLVMIIALICILPVVVYAAFSMTNSYNADVDYHTIDNATITSPTENLTLSFDHPGDSQTYTYTISNNDTKNYIYNFNFDSNSSSRLCNMIYVYQNGTFVGVLSDFLSMGNVTKNDLPISEYIFIGESNKTTTFTFELHNASEYYVINESVTLIVNCVLNTTNAQKYLFVKNEEEFIKAIDDVNSLAGKTIVLTNNIALSTAVTISKACTIDLCGKTLTLNAELMVTSEEECEVAITDSRNGGAISGIANLVLNSENALIIPKIDLTGMSVSNYNVDLLVKALSSKIKSETISSGETYDIFGYYSIYNGVNSFSAYIDGAKIVDVYNVSETLSTNDVLLIELCVSDVVYSGIDEEGNSFTASFEHKVIGRDDSVLTEIIDTHLKHLSLFADSENTYQIMNGIYLPTAIREYNATISWHSNNQSILSSEGIMGGKTGKVTLTATIKLYNQVYSKDYYLNVIVEDNKTKLQYLASKIEEKMLFTAIYNDDKDSATAGSYFDLPIAYLENTDNDNGLHYIDWAGKNLGIVDIQYEVEPTYDYISVENDYSDANSFANSKLNETDKNYLESSFVYLNKVTLQETARFIVRAQFEDDSVEEAFINAKIELGEEDLSDEVYSRVQDYLDSVNVLEIMLQTREDFGIKNESGDFDLLPFIDTIKIDYSVDENDLYEILTKYIKTVVEVENDYQLQEGDIVGTKIIDNTTITITEGTVYTKTTTTVYDKYELQEGEEVGTTTIINTESDVIVSSTTTTIFEKEYVHFKDYTQFKLTDSLVNIKAAMVISGEEITPQDMYFTIPGAITSDNFAPFLDDDSNEYSENDYIYTTIKYQTLQQSDSEIYYDKTVETPVLLSDLGQSSIITSLPKYILMHDVLETDMLIFEYGDSSIILDVYDLSVLKIIFDWATTENTLNIIDYYSKNKEKYKALYSLSFDDISPYINKQLSWITAGGITVGDSTDYSQLTDAEITFILDYCQKYSGFPSIWNEYVEVLDNVFTDADLVELKETLADDQFFVAIMEWLEDTEEYTLYEYIFYYGNREEIKAIIEQYYYDYCLKKATAEINAEISANEESYIKSLLKSQEDYESNLLTYIYTDIYNGLTSEQQTSDDLESIIQEEYEALTESELTQYETDYLDNLYQNLSEEEVQTYINTEIEKLTNEYYSVSYEIMVKYYLDNEGIPVMEYVSLETSDTITVSLPSKILCLSNNYQDSITNQEEKAIVYYIQKNYSEEQYRQFYSAWKTYITREDDTIDAADNGKEIKTSLESTAQSYDYSGDSGDEGSYKSCYDPIFNLILQWADYNENVQSDPSGKPLSDYITDNKHQKLFSSEQLNYVNDFTYSEASFLGYVYSRDYSHGVSTNEWNVIKYYCNTYYYSSEMTSLISSVDDTVTSWEFTSSRKTTTNYVGEKYSNASNNYECAYILEPTYINLLITEINSNYTAKSTAVSDFGTLVTWATSESLSYVSSLNISTTSKYNGCESDGFVTISYDEYCVLNDFYTNHVITIWDCDTTINLETNPDGTLKEYFANYYWLDYYGTLGTPALNMDFKNNILSDSGRNEILSTIVAISDFENIIQNSRYEHFGSTGHTLGSDYDGLATISYDEFKVLAEAYSEYPEFISVLNSVFTAYTATVTDDIVTVTTNSSSDDKTLDRSIFNDTNNIYTDINKLLDNSNVDKVYKYVPIEQIDKNEIDIFNVLKYYSNLNDLTLMGNTSTYLFEDSQYADAVYKIIVSSAPLLTRFTMSYCKLSILDGIDNLIYLERLDVKGNPDLIDISPILILIDNQLENSTNGLIYFNIHQTGVTYENAELVMTKLLNEFNCESYYTLAGIETLFEISIMVDYAKVVLELASSLYEIGIIKNDVVILPKYVYTANYTGSITWRIEEGTAYAIISGNELERRDTTETQYITVSATVTLVGNTSYTCTRYFIIEVPSNT